MDTGTDDEGFGFAFVNVFATDYIYSVLAISPTPLNSLGSFLFPLPSQYFVLP